ncbi:MAG: restriction endonuclease subunit S [Candidatus Manganitrophus sp. SB1]|nr:restriction endonuclease subunit S [Candidatus Manganitrophus morganii]
MAERTMMGHSLLLERPPRSWTPASFGDICSRVQDPASPSADGSRLYLGLEHLASGLPSLVGRGTESDVHSSKTTFRSGDVLFGKLRPYLRKSVLVNEDGICSTDILVFRATERCIPEFLCMLTHTDEFVGHAKATTSGVQHPRTSWASLREFKITIPPLDEQRKIAAVLGVVQRAIEQQERLFQLTAELKKALLHQLFTQGLRGEPQKQTEIGLVPESWGVVELANLFEIKHGFAFEGEFFASDGSYILLTPGHFFEEGGFRDQKDKTKFYTGDFPRSYLLEKGDLLVAMTEQKAGLLGSSIVIPESDKFLHNQRLGLIHRLHDSRLNKLFLYYFFNTADVRKHIAMTASGSKVRHTSPGKIRELKIALPSLDEQRQIVGVFQVADIKVELLRRKYAALTTLFRTLLHHLMTAQLRVKDFEIQNMEEFVRHA